MRGLKDRACGKSAMRNIHYRMHVEWVDFFFRITFISRDSKGYDGIGI